ncbi:MAG: endonuclease/exonuclease/phosphatase family protein [Rhodothermaceae bacterium]
MKKIFLLLGILLCLQSCNTTKKQSDSTTVKIMSFNIRYDNPGDSLNNWNERKFLVADIIKKEQPDIIGIQEALRHQLDDLSKMLPDYFWVGIGRDDGENLGEFAPVFYNKKRFKKYDSQTFWLSETPEKVSRGWDAACNRICTYIKLEDLTTNKVIMVFNTHFDHAGKIAQKESAKLITKKIFSLSESFPFVLTGDFNITSKSEAYKILGTQVDYFKMLDSKYNSKEKHKGIEATFTGFNKNYDPAVGAIDHIFVRNETTVLTHKTIDTLINNKFPSDHFPVVTEVIFNKALN